MPETFSLYELNEQIKNAIASTFIQPVWVRAEISEIRENANGHCYLELVEKDGQSDRITAKNKATIWSFTYRMLKPYFEASTGESLHAGLQILISCSVEYHELYGLSLNISDIDPTYTLGEIALRKQQILHQLQEEGIAGMNKELALPILPQRIAVISSETAAGYGDFLNQLQENSFGYRFYAHLVPAVMQGERTEKSLTEALDRIYTHIELFDVVVIIRGGGATADLSCFDRYLLAAHCAQFPLPILTGIGHQRDSTILDAVSYASLKTPTAVAGFLIDRMQEANGMLMQLTDKLAMQAEEIQDEKAEQLRTGIRKLTPLLAGRTSNHNLLLERYKMQLQQAAQAKVNGKLQKINGYRQSLGVVNTNILNDHKHLLGQKELQLTYSNPLSILAKGYTMTCKNGKRVTSSKNLQPGDTITTVFSDGSILSSVDPE